MRANAPFAGIYEKMTFPEYKFEEYPKWVTTPAGTNILVNSQSEELKVIGEVVPTKVLTSVESERDTLAAQVEDLQRKLAALVAAKESEPTMSKEAAMAGAALQVNTAVVGKTAAEATVGLAALTPKAAK